MKNIIVGFLTVLIIGLMAYTASKGRAFQGGEAGKITENVANIQKTESKATPIAQKSDREIENEKLKALRDKAGSVTTFKVSDNYKKKCASCHGAGGEGIVGLPLFGQSAEAIYTKLVEFKSGRRENAIMKGAIMNVNEADFKELSQEISEFKARAEALAK
ncbi:MAG: c-type cytochrome [Campylobacteraceae bacterium]|nr:c-type cytochrome [Campylobacteraceae bacterium]